MDYLKYIEHAAENLEFYLWLRTYVERWRNLPNTVTEISPPNSSPLVESRVYPPFDSTVVSLHHRGLPRKLYIPPKSPFPKSILRARLDKLLASFELDKDPTHKGKEALSDSLLPAGREEIHNDYPVSNLSIRKS